MSKVVINMEAHGRGSVTIDGVEVPMVTDIRFRASVGKPNRVLIVVLADRVELRAPVAAGDQIGALAAPVNSDG